MCNSFRLERKHSFADEEEEKMLHFVDVEICAVELDEPIDEIQWLNQHEI